MARRSQRWLITGVLLVAIGSLIVFLRPHWVVSWLARRSPDVLFFVETTRPVVALTIDDGPDEDTTPLILDVLDRHGVEATLFVITDRIAGIPTRPVERTSSSMSSEANTEKSGP